MLTLSQIYGYIFSNRADIHVSQVAPEKQASVRGKREAEIRELFASLLSEKKSAFRKWLRDGIR